MLQKTLSLIQKFRNDASVSVDEEIYGAEIERLVYEILKPLLWGPPQIRKKMQQLGINITPNNFYSEIPDLDAIERSFAGGWDDSYDYIFDRQRMESVLEDRLLPFSYEFDPPLKTEGGRRFAWENPAFSYSDATAYYCFIRHAKPRTIIEVGCGWSTLVADMALKENGSGQIICVDPFPPEFVYGIDSVASVVTLPVQHLDAGFFNNSLNDGDFIFIDSTHTVKHDSDCLHLYLKILPRLAATVLVQVHDVFLPRCLPPQFLEKQHIYWTEQYLVMAYLIDNSRTDVLYGSRYHFEQNLGQLTAFMRGRFAPGGASLWFSQAGAPDPKGVPR